MSATIRSMQQEWVSENEPRERVVARQWESLRRLLRFTYQNNPFYHKKLIQAGVTDIEVIDSPAAFRQLPLTTKNELLRDQEEHPPYGTNRSFPRERYTYWFRTSGTHNKPLVVLLTPEDQEVQVMNWVNLLREAGLAHGDTVFIPFSFGPFVALWMARSAAIRLGLLTIPGGGANTQQRVQYLVDYRPDAILCLPSYTLRLAEAAREQGIDPRQLGVRVLAGGGEVGASNPEMRDRMEATWGAKAFETYGLAEVGGLGALCQAQDGLHLHELQQYVEHFKPGTDIPAEEGEVAEIVTTTLCRPGTPLIRYRTGDLIRVTHQPCACGRTSKRTIGPVLGRADDMVVVRGVNVFPSAVESCVMSYREVIEYQAEVFDQRGMKAIRIRVEPDPAYSDGPNGDSLAGRIAAELHQRLFLRAEVVIVPPGSLPRWEAKAKRFVYRPESG